MSRAGSSLADNKFAAHWLKDSPRGKTIGEKQHIEKGTISL